MNKRRLPKNPEDNGFTQSQKDTVEFWKIAYNCFTVREWQNFSELIAYDDELKKWQDKGGN